MNPMQHMKDPAAGVPSQLLPHMHLVSKHRYPTVSNLSLDTIVGYLMEAPKIMRDLQPVQWQFLDPPPHEGRLMLVWQPLEHVGTAFASDGYVWGDTEQAFKSEIRGYTLEMFMHRSGYQAPGEPMASHSRKRYRLLPGNPALGLPHPDPSLWIVHYSKAAPRDHIPAASIPINPYVHAILQQRRMIQASGPLVRKDFMLHDRGNWPTINPPPGIAGRNPSGQTQAGHRRVTSANLPGEATLEEEEDVSRGDMLDFMTPREISRMRYEQHHEWMEEVLESHYATKKIIPADLGLGRKGELEALTRGFFEAPIAVVPEASADATPAQVGKMDAGKAREFTRAASSKMADMQAELEKMKRKHARRMDKLRRMMSLNIAEKKLRTASFMSDDQGEQNLSPSGASTAKVSAQNTADAIVDEVEEAWGRKIERITNVSLIEKGGLDERPAGNGSFSGVSTRNTMSPTKNVLSPTISQTAPNGMAQYTSSLPQLQQQHPSQYTQSTPENASADPSVPNSQSESTDADQVIATTNSEKANSPRQEDAPVLSAQEMDADAQMTGLDHQDDDDRQIDLDDNAWVMVDEDDDGNVETASHISREPSQSHQMMQENSADATSGTPGSGEQQGTPVGADQTPLESQPIGETPTLEAGEFDLPGDFDDVEVDTAGDALGDYGSEGDDLNFDTNDDSQFADAFRSHEDENTPMEDHASS